MQKAKQSERKNNIVTCPTYPDKFTWDILLHHLCDIRL